MARPRTWTDDQLREAVASCKTWADVSRCLNLPARGPTTHRLRRHALRLQIDTSHIPVRTEVTPLDSPDATGTWRARTDPGVLREAVEGSRSWAQVAAKLGLSYKSGYSYQRLQAAAKDAGIDVETLYGQGWSSAPLVPLPVPFSRPFDPAMLHRMGAAVATAWFIGRGYVVSVPVEPACYDLVVESDAALQRVQVKTTTVEVVGLTKTQYGAGTSPSSGKYGRRPYRIDEIDLFFIYSAADDMYLIPIAAVEGKSGVALARYARYRLPGLTERPYSNMAERSG